ncbi:MAG: hypothetical protein WC346_05100 [Methanogenium sp.]
MFAHYKILCNTGILRPGVVCDFICDDGTRVILFPTKIDWRNKSSYQYISDGIDNMRQLIINKYNTSQNVIGVPALGCGLGGLDWVSVKDIMLSKLNKLDAVIIIFEP